MKTKKFLAICLTLCMGLCLLAGCGGDSGKDQTTPPADTGNAADTGTGSENPYEGHTLYVANWQRDRQRQQKGF